MKYHKKILMWVLLLFLGIAIVIFAIPEKKIVEENCGVTQEEKDKKKETEKKEENGKNGKTIKLIADGKIIEFNTEKTLTGEILAEAGITIGHEDRVLPSVDEVTEDKIQIIRVSRKTVEEKKALPFCTEERQSTELFKGETRILEKGEKGTEKHVYEIIQEDGKEIKRNLIKKVTVKEPVNQVVALGKRGLVSRSGEILKLEKAMEMSATAYTHTGRKTYTNVWPSVGVVAVDPKLIPLGSRLYIDGYGFATALDIGSSIKGNRIDLFFETKEEALKWGRRKVQVFVLRNE